MNAATTPAAYGRFAPSPSGQLHLGNFRTAVLAWLFAHHHGLSFRLRIDDIDASRSDAGVAAQQLDDLAALGLTWAEPVRTQQSSLAEYRRALEHLSARGHVYECYCSRRDIQEATRAAHGDPGTYPGTCRDLSEAQRTRRREALRAAGRVPSLRLRAEVEQWEFRELFAEGGVATDGGVIVTGDVDDFVVRRGGNIIAGHGPGEPHDDGAGGHSNDFAYNLTVVIDDVATGVTQVTRGDDLLSSSARQSYLASLLDIPPVDYVHVPLVLGPTGKRLAKRDGAVCLHEFASPSDALAWIIGSLGEAIDPTSLTKSRDLADSIHRIAHTFEPRCLSSDAVRWAPV